MSMSWYVLHWNSTHSICSCDPYLTLLLVDNMNLDVWIANASGFWSRVIYAPLTIPIINFPSYSCNGSSTNFTNAQAKRHESRPNMHANNIEWTSWKSRKYDFQQCSSPLLFFLFIFFLLNSSFIFFCFVAHFPRNLVAVASSNIHAHCWLKVHYFLSGTNRWRAGVGEVC